MQSAHLGSRVILSCNSSSIPKWYHNKKRLAVTRQEIVLENVNKSNRGLYTCRGMDSAGKNTVKTFRLVVISKEDRIIPKHVRAPVGGKAKFRCDSGNFKATFTHNHDVLPKNAYVHESTLLVYNVTFSNGGKYICSGLDGSYLQFVAEAYLIVVDKKMISPMELIVCQYCTAKFSCRSDTLPKWLFNGRMIPSNAHPNSKHLLNIYSVESYNEGYYECLGTTREGYEFSAMAYLRVIFLDKHRVVPHYQEVYVGQRARIICNSSSHVYWKFNETTSVPSNVFITGRALNIPKTKLENAGLYYCISKDVDEDYHFYSPSELIVLKKCQSPKMKNGNVTLRGTTALFKCNKYYKLQGSSALKCQPGGEWMERLPYCKLDLSGVVSHFKYDISILMICLEVAIH